MSAFSNELRELADDVYMDSSVSQKTIYAYLTQAADEIDRLRAGHPEGKAMSDPRLDDMDHYSILSMFYRFTADLMQDVRNASYAQAADRMRKMADRIARPRVN